MDTNIYITRRSSIYGIRLYTFTNKQTILYERTSDTPLLAATIKEAHLFYESVKEPPTQIKIQIKCENIEDNEDKIMVWWNMSPAEFMQMATDPRYT